MSSGASKQGTHETGVCCARLYSRTALYVSYCPLVVGTVLPGVLRWPYLALFFALYLLLRLLGRVVHISPHAAEKRHPGQEPEPGQKHHDRQPATGTHG